MSMTKEITKKDKTPKKPNYMLQVENSTYKRLPPKLWRQVILSGLPELTQDTNIKKYKSFELKMPKEVSKKLKEMDSKTLEEIAHFDNHVKENYGGWIVNVVSYKEGKIYVVKYY